MRRPLPHPVRFRRDGGIVRVLSRSDCAKGLRATPAGMRVRVVCVGVSVVSRSLSRSRLPYKQASSDTATRAGASAKSRQDCRQVRRARAAAHRCGRRQVSSRSYREHILVAREHILAARECILSASELVRLAIPPAHPRHLQISLWGLDFIHVRPCG